MSLTASRRWSHTALLCPSLSIPRAAALWSVTALLIAGTAQGQSLGGVKPTPEAAAAMLQARPELVTQLRQRLMSSGMTPEQVRARLKAEGYPENLLDAYLTGGNGAATAPTGTVLSAMRALGVMDAADADDLGAMAAGRPMKAAPVADPEAKAEDGLSAASAEIFGLSVFRQSTSRFQPNLDGPVDAGYRVGPGDELVLILTGDVELSQTLEITRGGFVVIPQVGQLSVANLTLGQLEDVLYARLGRVYSGVRRGADATTKFSITVSKLRSNQVFVVGDVVTPGAYRISSAGTAMTALYAAGGPNERGSLRAVELRRAGKTVATLDVYAYLLRGDAAGDVRLQQGDVLFVPVRGARVRIDGEVTRPATYELRTGEQLADVLQAAGGFRATATGRRLLVDRVVPRVSRPAGGAERTSIDVALSADAVVPTFAMADGDVVRVPRIADRVRNRITVNGHVWTPGAQGFTAGLTLEEALRRAGGVKADAYLGRVLVTRLRADSTRVQLRAMLRDSTGATIEPFVLQADDEITAYSRTTFRPERYVAITGAVQKGGRFAYREGMTLRDLVMQAGGLSDLADLAQAEIARRPVVADAQQLSTTVRVALDSSYLLAEGRPLAGVRDEPLQPYDNVLIFADPARRAPIAVKILGEVRYPGSYVLKNRAERLSDLVARAGGLTNEGDASATYFSRRVEQSAQVTTLVKSASTLRSDSAGRALAAIADTARLESGGSRIRVGVDVVKALGRADALDNLMLVDGDSVFVPPKQFTVSVRGEVNAPTSLVATGRSLGAYIRAAGGATAVGDTRKVYVIQPNGKIQSRVRVLGFMDFDPTPQPGATVVVPAQGERQTLTTVLQTTSIIVQSLTALATVWVLFKK